MSFIVNVPPSVFAALQQTTSVIILRAEEDQVTMQEVIGQSPTGRVVRGQVLVMAIRRLDPPDVHIQAQAFQAVKHWVETQR